MWSSIRNSSVHNTEEQGTQHFLSDTNSETPSHAAQKALRLLSHNWTAFVLGESRSHSANKTTATDASGTTSFPE